MIRADKYPQIIMRLALGIGFIYPVLDRMGCIGLPGSSGVVWGDWSHFVSYTQTLVPFAGNTTASYLAAMATIAEIMFGCCLIAGFKTRLMALGSAALTAVFGICMAVFIKPMAAVGYPVFVFTGGALLLACVPRFYWSADNLIKTFKNKGRKTSFV